MRADTAPPSPHPLLPPNDIDSPSPSPKQNRSDFHQPPPLFPLGYKEAACQWWSGLSASVAERNVLKFIPFLQESLSSAPSSTPTDSHSHSSSTSVDQIDRRDPHGPRTWQVARVALSGKNRTLNEFSVQRVSDLGEADDDSHQQQQINGNSGQEHGDTDTLVMLHGYGAGLAFFYQNFEPLSRPLGWKLYALDMLGMGNSSRPPFSINAKDPDARVAEAENWFIDALEEWRQIRNIQRFTLLGHSLGGYLAVSYALKYPGRLNKLILASPVGIPEDPFATPAHPKSGMVTTLADEFTRSQEDIVHTSNPSTRHSSDVPTTTTESSVPERRKIPSWVNWLWNANVSPFSMVRLAGPLGPRFVSGWTSRRFNHLDPAESQALHAYSYTLFRQAGSGEYALAYLLAPGAYARRPLINRIDNLGRQEIPAPSPFSSLSRASSSRLGFRPLSYLFSSSSSPSSTESFKTNTPTPTSATTTPPNGTPPSPSPETGLPVVFMYGENDWMDVAGGLAAEEKLNQARARALQHASADEQRRDRGTAKVLVVPRAGHHLYLDNPDVFNSMVLEEMDETRRASR